METPPSGLCLNQDMYAHNGRCSDCGPRNEEGLRLKSVPPGDGVVAVWKPKAQHAAFGIVASEYTVKFLRPSPMGAPCQLAARTTAINGNRVSVSGELRFDGVVKATMTGLFLAVRESHPAFHRWH